MPGSLLTAGAGARARLVASVGAVPRALAGQRDGGAARPLHAGRRRLGAQRQREGLDADLQRRRDGEAQRLQRPLAVRALADLRRQRRRAAAEREAVSV